MNDIADTVKLLLDGIGGGSAFLTLAAPDAGCRCPQGTEFGNLMLKLLEGEVGDEACQSAIVAGQQVAGETGDETSDESTTVSRDSDHLLRSPLITPAAHNGAEMLAVPAATWTGSEAVSQPEAEVAPIEPRSDGAVVPSQARAGVGTETPTAKHALSGHSEEVVPAEDAGVVGPAESPAHSTRVVTPPAVSHLDILEARQRLEVGGTGHAESATPPNVHVRTARPVPSQYADSLPEMTQAEPVVATERDTVSSVTLPRGRTDTEVSVVAAEDAGDLRPVESVDAPHSSETREHPTESHDAGTHFADISDLPGTRASEVVTGSRAHLPPHEVLATKMIHQIVKSARLQVLDGGAEMTIRLDPPHLGTLRMTVSAQEGTVTASLQTTTETARQVLEADLSGLRHALSDAGIRVDNVEVSVGGNLDQGWSAQDGRHEAPAGHRRGTGLGDAHAFESQVAAVPFSGRHGSNGLLDFLA